MYYRTSFTNRECTINIIKLARKELQKSKKIDCVCFFGTRDRGGRLGTNLEGVRREGEEKLTRQ